MSIWTNPENVRLLEVWVKRGYSASQIVSKFAACCQHVTRNGVIGKCHRIGLALGGEGAAAVPTPPPHVPEPPPAAAQADSAVKRSRVRTPLEASPVERPAAVPRPVPMAEPETPAAAPAGEVAIGAVLLMAARAEQCRFPVSGEGAGMLVCGAHVALGRVYCRPHHILTHQPPRPPVSMPRDRTVVRTPRDDAERDVFETMGDAA